jgi:hypothetical protein
VDSLNHRDIAVSTHNACWTYLENDGSDVLALAFASHHHRSRAGDDEQAIITRTAAAESDHEYRAIIARQLDSVGHRP